MSQENVEIVRQFVLLELEEALTYADPDIIWTRPRSRRDRDIPEEFVDTADQALEAVGLSDTT